MKAYEGVEVQLHTCSPLTERNLMNRFVRTAELKAKVDKKKLGKEEELAYISVLEITNLFFIMKKNCV
jgi:hypothetical protein